MPHTTPSLPLSQTKTPVVLWFTGLSGAGKSTTANLVLKHLQSLGLQSCVLDGDELRRGLNRDLGFSDADRSENIRRVAEVARLLRNNGLIVLTALISPFHAGREQARQIIGEGVFIEIFVDAPLAVVEQRDVKGLYKKARSGLLPDFTGIDSAYEAPESPALRLRTDIDTPEQSMHRIVAFLQERGVI
jgi:bifunctional enzyme CysN/CysC